MSGLSGAGADQQRFTRTFVPDMKKRWMSGMSG